MVTLETLTYAMVRELAESLERIIVTIERSTQLYKSGELQRVSIARDHCTTALYEFDYPSARIESRRLVCELLNARTKETK